MKFKLIADAIFDADDLSDAADKIVEHFLCIACEIQGDEDHGYSKLEYIGAIEIKSQQQE